MRDARDGIAYELKARGLKQSFVASKAGLTERQFSDILCKRRRLEANEMFRICRVMSITPDVLFAEPVEYLV